MASQLPPLAAIRCFEAAARHQSFTRAAQELGMTQAAVSYQIKVLEDRIGGALFVRGTRGVTLTETGRQLAPSISEAFAQLRGAFSQLSESASNVLSVTALTTFATNWLVPRLGSFQIAHPEIAVRLEASNVTVDLTREEFDIGIRSGSGSWPGLVSHGLFAAAFTPMLSPRLLERYGPLKEPSDLLKLPLVDPTDDWWKEWFEEAGMAAPDLSDRTGIQVQNQQLAGRAALAMQGVAILMPAFFPEELASGQLVQPFPILRQAQEFHYWLVYPEARRRAAKIRAFRDWILAEVTPELGSSGTATV
jgi:LysR family glycine cleavage system transcriptional activator